MNIDSLKTTLMTLSVPQGLAGQGSGQQAAAAAAGQSVQGSAAPVAEDVVSVNRKQPAASDEEEKRQQVQNKAAESLKAEIYKYKAFFAVDDDKNVVIRFVDKKGKVVQQVPPEEYLDMMSKLRASTENLFSAKA
ncbi:MAG TPA: flagellar protein FlaG [Dissulfurispiraceae bacterium]|nr:flagellar protein FlaG [Dissulfurispiraceae bacterium]